MIDDEKGGADDSDDPGDILVVEARDAEGEAEHGEVVILLCRSGDREARGGATRTSGRDEGAHAGEDEARVAVWTRRAGTRSTRTHLFSESRFLMTSHHDARGELRASGDAALRIDRRASM